jgi:SAM-dependent methyltransferase
MVSASEVKMVSPAPSTHTGVDTVDLAAIATNLTQGADGIWTARSQSSISYPDEGNLNCLALEADSFWFKHRNRCIHTVVKRFSPPGPLFDVGGGNGYVAMGLQRAGIPVILVEPGWQGVQNARVRGVRALVCSTLEDAGFLPGSLPAVGAFDVLEHIESDVEFLTAVHQRLVPGGYLYLTVPAFQALWSADDDYAGHYRRYTLAGLRSRLERAGYQVIFASYIFFMLPLPIWLGRSLPSRLGMRKQEAWDRYQAEHSAQPGLVGRAMDALLGLELAILRSGKSIPLGGSCLVAARKAL